VSGALDLEVAGKGLSTLGTGVGTSLITKAKGMGVELPADFEDPTGSMKPAEIGTRSTRTGSGDVAHRSRHSAKAGRPKTCHSSPTARRSVSA
jgi:hypothetical protein